MAKDETQTSQLLREATRAIHQASADDPASIAPVGLQLEAILDDLPDNAPKLGTYLSLILELLQQIYQAQELDAEADLQMAAEALQAAADWARHGFGERNRHAYEHLGQQLWLRLDRDPQLSPFTPARHETNLQASDGDTQQLQPHHLTIHDIAAQLIGLSIGDHDDLRRLRKATAELARNPDWPPQARHKAEQAAAALRKLTAEHPQDPTALLQQATSAIGAIPDLLEPLDGAAPPQQEAEPDEPGARDAHATPQPDRPQATPDPPDVHQEPLQETTNEEAPEPESQQPHTPNQDPSKPDGEIKTLEFDADPALLAEFATESLEHLENAELSILDLEADPDDPDAVGAVFRAFHTVKGTAGFLGLENTQRLAHHAESLLDRVRNGEIRLTGGYADLALDALDALRRMVRNVRDIPEGDPLPQPPDIFADLMQALQDPEGAGFSEDSGAATPAVARTGDILVAEGTADRDSVERAATDPTDEPIGRKLVQSGAADTKSVADALRRQRMAKDAAAGTTKPTDDTRTNTIRVRTDRLDDLINMVGELVVADAMLGEDEQVQASATRPLGRKVDQISKITRELQDVGMSLRMVPLRGTFKKMSRTVRDLARDSGKQVQLATEGEHTEIDRNMAEALADPLLHMVRNAVDHGIEAPQERRNAGKPQTGTVVLRAYHSGGRVVIEVQDDGAGLDREKILRKAIDKGVVAPDEDLSDQQVYKLIFSAGLSTTDNVTDVSGRGVGMDVVRQNIEALRGNIDIASKKGEGTTFKIGLPLTLAIIDGMLVRVGPERYIIPTLTVREAFSPQKDDLNTVSGRAEMVRFRGQLVPLVRLHRLFAIPDARHDIDSAVVVLLQADDEVFALLVDDMLGQQQIVIKSLGEGLGDVPGVSGAAVLGDGSVGLILDAPRLIALARHGQNAADISHEDHEAA